MSQSREKNVTVEKSISINDENAYPSSCNLDILSEVLRLRKSIFTGLLIFSLMFRENLTTLRRNIRRFSPETSYNYIINILFSQNLEVMCSHCTHTCNGDNVH